jgi:phage tail-like protein
MVASSRALYTDPLRSFKFNVCIPQQVQNVYGIGGNTNMARLGFMSVQGLGVSIEPLTYREGGDNLTTRKMPGQADFNPITFSRGMFPQDNDNYNWLTNIFTALYGGGINQFVGKPVATDFRTLVYINVLQHPNNQAQNATNPYESSYPQQNSIVQLSFKLYSAWISSLAYSDLDAGGNAVGIEQMTLNYEGFDMLWGGRYGASGLIPASVVNNW